MVNSCENIALPRRATINKTAELGVMSEYSLRLMLKRGELPGYYAGTRFYVNIDRLIEMMGGDSAPVTRAEGE